MNTITLFDNKERNLESPADYNADIYKYYNDSSRPEVNNLRRLLEGWFSEYPDEEKLEVSVYGNLRSCVLRAIYLYII